MGAVKQSLISACEKCGGDLERSSDGKELVCVCCGPRQEDWYFEPDFE